MTIPISFIHPDFKDVQIDASGRIKIGHHSGGYREPVWRTFTAEDLRTLAGVAERNKAAYHAYGNCENLDEDAYFKVMKEIPGSD